MKMNIYGKICQDNFGEYVHALELIPLELYPVESGIILL